MRNLLRQSDGWGQWLMLLRLQEVAKEVKHSHLQESPFATFWLSSFQFSKMHWLNDFRLASINQPALFLPPKLTI